MNKVVSFAMLALLALAAACGPKAQAGGGTTVAPPVGGAPASGTSGAAPSGSGGTDAAPPMNATPGSAPAAP